MRLSEHLAKIESRVEKRFSRWKRKHKADGKLCIALGIFAWYFYGMLINSIRLGVRQTFAPGGNAPASIWVVNPFRNILAPFTPTGIGTTVVCALLICLITKKGYNRFSGYHFIRDRRGFDILPDGTHGTARFMKLREMEQILEVGKLDTLSGNVYGKYKDDPSDDDAYASYVASSNKNGLANNILVLGAPGTGKSWGFVRPFIMQCVKRRESIVLTDPKNEIFTSMSGYLSDQGYEVRVFNLLDMHYSDHWNCIGEADYDAALIPIIAATIINNTSSDREANDFWAKAELNLLTALLHYVQNETDDAGKKTPLSARRLGRVLSLLTEEGLRKIDEDIKKLPRGHPAKGPYGLFLQAKENLRGNIVIGLGNRLNVFQDKIVDSLTADTTIDLTLPGKKPCAYFCILSAQDSTYAFLSSLFFTMLFSRLEMTARRETADGKLPVPVNMCLDEFPSIGKLGDFRRSIAFTRGFRINCQVLVQSIAQLADMYPRHEWEEIVACCDTTICLGVNDQMSADFISKKCGTATIRVTNNQMPLTPLFSPVYTSTRPYSQTRSNTQRALMQPDEVLRMDNRQSIVLLRGGQPMLLYKVTPQEFSDFAKLRTTPITAYHPCGPCYSYTEHEQEHRGADDAASAPQEKEHEEPALELRYDEDNDGWPEGAQNDVLLTDEQLDAINRRL